MTKNLIPSKAETDEGFNDPSIARTIEETRKELNIRENKWEEFCHRGRSNVAIGSYVVGNTLGATLDSIRNTISGFRGKPLRKPRS